MFIATLVFAADLSIMLPRPKPEIPLPVEKQLTETVVVLSPVRKGAPETSVAVTMQQVETLKRLEVELKERSVQQRLMGAKLDQLLRREEAKDVGGQ